MEYVNFGSAGIKVSKIALGMAFRGQADEAMAQRVVEYAIEQGINLIDCANVYGPMDDRANIGRSEMILGRALKGKREDVVITTKVCGQIGSGPNDSGLSRAHIMREVQRSLKRLDTDYIDVYLVHGPDVFTPQEETIRALDDLVRSGIVRYIGCCNHAAWQVCRALWLAEKLHCVPYMCVQHPYSLVNRGLETEMFGLVREQGLGVMAYSPLGVGLLTGTYTPDNIAPIDSLWGTRRKDIYANTMTGAVGELVKLLHTEAAHLTKTPAQLALAWVLSRPEVSVAITGADTIEHIKDNLGGIGWAVPTNVLAELNQASSALRLILD